MEPIHYLRALRRRWWVIVASVVVAIVAAWVTTAALSSPKVVATRHTTYSATTTLWNVGAPTLGAAVTLPEPVALANLVTLPEVSSIAAQANPAVLDSKVYATTDPQIGRLVITGTASSPEQAVAVSTAYSRALITYLERLKQKKITAQQRVVERQIQNLQRQGSHPDLVASLRSTLGQFAIDRTTPIPLQIYQPPSAVRDTAPDAVAASSGIQVPKSLPLRLALAALLGLLAGVILALVLERFDTRIRSPRAAEEAFGLPVLAEVPAISRGRRGTIVTASYPSSRAADAFRLVGVGTARWPSHTNGNGSGPQAKTLLITSPEARDGKTTVAANLAVAYAQAGSRVLVVSCDLRRPAIHELFGVDERPGLADLLERTNDDADPAGEPDLATYLEPCSVVRVAVVPSGVASEHPGELLGSAKMQRFLERLKKITDVIILDCAPLVVASDVVPLLPEADGVIIVARARKTRGELAASTAALLERMGAPTAGVVLNDAREFSIPLAKRRMYRPTKQMRKAAKRDGPSRTEEPSTLAPFVEHAPVDEHAPVVEQARQVEEAPEVEQAPVVEEAAPEPAEEPQPRMRPPSAASSDGGDGSRQPQMLVAERTVQIPPAEESRSSLACEPQQGSSRCRTSCSSFAPSWRGCNSSCPTWEPTRRRQRSRPCVRVFPVSHVTVRTHTVYCQEGFMLATPQQVIWALITYTDWWQPSTESVYRIGARRQTFASDGIPGGLLDTLSVRDELCRRMLQMRESDRRLLWLWYLRQLPVHEIAQDLRIGRRQCFRRRASAIRRLVELGDQIPANAVPA